MPRARASYAEARELREINTELGPLFDRLVRRTDPPTSTLAAEAVAERLSALQEAVLDAYRRHGRSLCNSTAGTRGAVQASRGCHVIPRLPVEGQPEITGGSGL